MASTLAPLTPLPPPGQRVVEVGGQMNKDWYLYLQRLDAHIRDIERRLTAGGL